MISWIFCINLICLERRNPFEVVGVRVGKAATAQLERKRHLHGFSPPRMVTRAFSGASGVFSVQLSAREVPIGEMQAQPHDRLEALDALNGPFVSLDNECLRPMYSSCG